jgi:nitrite reductase/ring-hydroxylating ferredoxin subunit
VAGQSVLCSWHLALYEVHRKIFIILAVIVVTGVASVERTRLYCVQCLCICHVWIFNICTHSVQQAQDRQCTYEVTMNRVDSTTVAVDKQYALHILSVSVALVILHAKRMDHIVY